MVPQAKGQRSTNRSKPFEDHRVEDASEEEQHADIAIDALQVGIAVEPYPALEDRVQDAKAKVGRLTTH